ncbi:hypothetical protein D3C74_346760 [compost metagenome]
MASSMTSQTLTPRWSATIESSLANAILTSRNEFSVSLVSSAVRASVRCISPSQNERYRFAAFSAEFASIPPTTRSLLMISFIMRPGMTRSGQWAKYINALVRSGLRSCKISRIISVVPTGEVLSKMNKSSAFANKATDSTADRM